MKNITKTAQFNNFFSGVDEVYVFQGPLALLQGGFFGWLQIIRLGFGFCAGCSFFFILIERVLATIKLKNYETSTNNGISAVFIILHNIIAILGAVIFFSGLQETKNMNKNGNFSRKSCVYSGSSSDYFCSCGVCNRRFYFGSVT